MQLGDLLCYALITIAVTTTCVNAKKEKQKETKLEETTPRRIVKRDASLLIDNFPIESVSQYNSKPRVIFRRISRHRFDLPKGKRGPYKPKYGVPPPKRKPNKKYRKQLRNIYGPPTKTHSPKPRYGAPKRPLKKPVYGPPKKAQPPPPPAPYKKEPAGFAEPPVDVESQHPAPHSYAEPPVDSYGAPLKLPKEIYSSAPGYDESQNFDQTSYSNMAQEFHPWQSLRDTNVDNSFAYSKKRPLVVKPDENYEVHIDDETVEEHGYEEVRDNIKYKDPYFKYNKKKPQFFVDTNKAKKYWNSPKYRREKVKSASDEILVGGQYAEPPARYVPRFQPSAPMLNGEDDFTPSLNYEDFLVPTPSAVISPYVNYINSNMAFSPQNLNDAFSSR